MTRPTLRRAVPDTFLDAPDYNWNFDQVLDYVEDIEDDVAEIESAITGNLVPVGTVILFAVNSVPSGYLLCNGAAVSRTDYSALFAKIGTTWGSGDGSSTFNVPNLIGKILKSDYVNQWNTTIWTSVANLNHNHGYAANPSYAVYNTTDAALGDHNHSLTVATVTLLPCIKY